MSEHSVLDFEVGRVYRVRGYDKDRYEPGEAVDAKAYFIVTGRVRHDSHYAVTFEPCLVVRKSDITRVDNLKQGRDTFDAD